MEGESSRSNLDGQDDANASFIEMPEYGVKKLSEEIEGMIRNLDTLPASSPKHCCIYKVSDHIRKSNEEAYTPQVISIGPFHRDNRKLQTMERFKLRYLKSFTDRAERKLEDIVSTIKGAEESVRECYSETNELGSDEFVKMILVDASFIIEYFWNKWSKGNLTEDEWEILTPWQSNTIQMDLILLENQLPFFIIDIIYETAFPSLSKLVVPFIGLTFRQFEDYNVQNFLHSDSERILHFTDLLRNFRMPPPQRRPEVRRSQNMKEMYSAAQLDEVGLKFKKRESSDNINWSPLELKYHANGVLEIPSFHLDSTTEIYARNLVAFEQCHYHGDPYITNYYFLLRSLIRSRKDVFFLVHKEIVKLVDCVDDMDAISMLNKMLENIGGLGMNNCYSQLAEESNKFYKARVTHLQIMMAILKRDYFPTPWRGAATIGGILLLLLTVIQTVCSLISVKNGK